jgi:hypothetical protein
VFVCVWERERERERRCRTNAQTARKPRCVDNANLVHWLAMLLARSAMAPLVSGAHALARNSTVASLRESVW